MKPLSEVMKSSASGSILRAARAQAALRRWPEIVGEIIAAKSEPVRYRDGVAWIAAVDSSWRQELDLRQEEILDRLNRLAGGAKLFSELRVEVGRKRQGFDSVDAEP
jgi:predicted nucleic acid-binding Zn ribbon protein